MNAQMYVCDDIIQYKSSIIIIMLQFTDVNMETLEESMVS